MVDTSSHEGVTCASGIARMNDVALSINVFLIDNMLIDTGPVSLISEFIPFF